MVGRASAAILLVAATAACGSASAPAGAASTAPTAAARSLHVNGAVNSYIVVGDTAQFTATATLIDNTTRDVTAEAAWTTSDPAIFAVAPNGRVTALKVGSADVRATWDGVSDKDYTTAQPFLTFAVYGTITAAPPDFAPIDGARVSLTPGSTADVTTDAAGDFTFPAVKGGVYTVTVRRDGFVADSRTITLTRDTRADFPLLPVPPAGATARCKDRSWSFAADRASACARNGGVAYFVCPGPLCGA